MKWLWINLLFLVSDIHSIQTHIQARFIDHKSYSPRHFRHIDSSSTHFDWEHSLREATLQALYREHVEDPNLRKHIYSAPLLGKQNKATPFGDIAMLARGQLYANYAGYIFVQDPYQNDCDDCHNIDIEAVRERCIASHCQIWHRRNNEHIIALWSVKRIRHRSDGYNKMEFEYTISPVGFRHSKEKYVTKDGTFNYNLPGHVFLLKSSKIHQNLDSEPKVNHFKPGALIAQTLDGTKYILHSFPGILALEPPGYQGPTKNALPTSTTATTQYSQENPKQIYQTLLEVLHQKTSPGAPGFTLVLPETTVAATTLVQFPDGQVIPITDLQSSFITKTTPSYVTTVKFPETSSSSQSNGKYTSSAPSTFKPSTQQIPSTTSQTQTPHDFYTTPFLTTPSKFQPIYTESSKVEQRPTQISTEAPMKTTFHFFAAEEVTKKPFTTTQQQQQNSEPDIILFDYDTVKPTKPTSVSTQESTRYGLKTTQGLQETTATSSSHPRTTEPITTTYKSTEPSTKTTKPAYSDFSIPIMVLEEETSVGTTLQKKYPSTLGPKPQELSTNTQFYTTMKTPLNQETTTIATTRVTPTYVSEGIKTTVGVTRIMGTTQNLNTGMTIYAAEDTEITPSSSNKPDSTSTIGKEIEVTSTDASSSNEPTTPSAPKKIVTMIDADGKVTVKTTSFYPEEELFGLTKSSPKKLKPTKSYKVSPTPASDFLIEKNAQEDKTPLFRKPFKDYNEDDIFGSTKSTTIPIKKTTVREYLKSDVEKALFDSNKRNRKSKDLIERKSSTTETTPSKVLYSSYFEASTLPMTTESSPATTLSSAVIATPSVTDSIPKRKLTIPNPKLRKVEENNPVTSQSYLTSISYEVNKKSSKEHINITKGSRLNKASIEKINSTMKDSKEDDFALRLIGQAKGQAYLDQMTTSASTVASVSAKTTKKPKYLRRRSYISRAKRPGRKKIAKSTENTNKK